MSSQEDYIKKGTQCRCRACGTVVEVIDQKGMMVDYKPVSIANDDIQQQVFAVFCIEFEPLDSEK
jgi:hypothetical protein